jgi:hypothetical protein
MSAVPHYLLREIRLAFLDQKLMIFIVPSSLTNCDIRLHFIHDLGHPRPAHTKVSSESGHRRKHAALQLFSIGEGELPVIELLFWHSYGCSTHEIRLNEVVNF